jgi:hypothetical protein
MDQLPTHPENISRRGFLGRAALTAGLAAGGMSSAAFGQQPRGPGQLHVGTSRFPISQISPKLARHIIYGDCGLCLIGDSISTDGSSASNIPYGIQRTWRPQQWVARFGRASIGPPPWAVDVEQTLNDVVRTTPAPGMPFSGGQVALSPNSADDHTFVSNNLPDHWYPWRFKLNDGINYAANDPFSGAATMARVIWWRAPGHATMRIFARRGNAEVSAPFIVDMSAGSAGMTFTDMDCGAGLDAPGLYIGKNGNQIGNRVYYLGCGVYRHQDGQRRPGFGLMQVGEGGWTTAHHRDVTRCTDANLAAFFQATLRPNTFLLHIANSTPEEIASLNVGNTSLFAANVAALMNRYANAAILAGATQPIRWLLVNHFPLDVTDLYLHSRGRALYQVAQADPENRGFIDLGRLAAMRHAAGSWYTVDGVHPSPAGATYLSGLLWSQIVAAAG